MDRHPSRLATEELLARCRLWRARRSGPGGQHRNKVETAVVIEHLPTGMRAEASERRSQEQNRRVALFRLRVQLALNVRSPVNDVEDFRPSELWESRLHGRRLYVSGDHEDFPALLAEALDAAWAFGLDLTKASAVLQTTTSQLVKLLTLEPAALALVNDERKKAGLHGYH